MRIQDPEMKVLLTNDDGIGAEGLVMMARGLVSRGHEVLVTAPAFECSGESHRITLKSAISFRKRGFPVEVSGSYEVSGSPADCVKIGMLHLFPGGVELAVSGVNSGINVGVDVLYSGTVAAAREALIRGIGAIAVSAQGPNQDYALAVDTVLNLVDALRKTPLPSGVMLNVNVPRDARAKGGRVAVTYQDGNMFEEEGSVREDPAQGGMLLEFKSRVSSRRFPAGSDCRAVLDGEISATPLGLDLNRTDAADFLRGLLRS